MAVAIPQCTALPLPSEVIALDPDPVLWPARHLSPHVLLLCLGLMWTQE